MKIIEYNKKSIWLMFKENFLNNDKYSIEFLSKYLNINKGTIKRWILLEEVPQQYFVSLNKLLNFKYKLNVNSETHFKIYDQFFTKTEEAKRIIVETLSFIKKNFDINLNEYTFIEPSAGNGAFYENIPNQFKKIGLDIEPQNNNIQKMDFFEYVANNKKNIVIGNPPFGLRGQLALKFINKASKFADFICFILPPLFNSNGKGSPMLRVNKNFYLAKEMSVSNEFFFPNNKPIKVNAIFQIWTKIPSIKFSPINIENKTSEWMKIYSLSNGNNSSSKRNVKMIGHCDVYLPSTTFHKIKLVNNFYDLPNNRGYGITILKNKEKILKILKKINWEEVGFKSTNGANNLRTQLIINALEREIKNDDKY